MSARTTWCACLGLAALLASAGVATAGPPYVTDDPEPTEPGHWEIYNLVSVVHPAGETDGQAGFDINYGGAKDLQLTAVIPVNFDRPGPTGLGDIQLAAKYRFVHQADSGWTPDVAFFPRLFVPTAGPAFGPQRFSLFLPLWAQKDVGAWSVFGGGGYDINPGPGNRDYWQSGLAVTRKVGERLSLGAEVFHQGAATEGGKALTGVNVGFTYQMTRHWALIAAGGPGVQNARQAGQYDAYAALYFTY